MSSLKLLKLESESLDSNCRCSPNLRYIKGEYIFLRIMVALIAASLEFRMADISTMYGVAREDRNNRDHQLHKCRLCAY